MKKIIITVSAILAMAALILGDNLIRSACYDNWVKGWQVGRAQAEEKVDPEKIYPACGVVVALDYTADTVTVKDAMGFTWVFYGVEDWQTGDVVAMIMFDYGTPSIKDDEILDVKYCGVVEWFIEIASSVEME